MILVNNQLDAQFFMHIYFYSLHVSGSHVPFIRRIIVSMRHLVFPERPSSAPDPAKPPCSLIESFQAKGRTYSIKTAKVNLLAKETNKIPIREEEREYFQLITKCWIIYASAVV